MTKTLQKNLETSLDYILGNFLKDEMIAYMHSHPDRFDELIELAIADRQPHSARAAWLLSHCTGENDARVKKNIPRIINIIPNVSDGQKRDLINVLRKMEIEEEHEGLLFDICVKIWSNINKIPSVRVIAFRLIIEIAHRHKELNSEITLLTQDFYLEPLSRGIKSSVKRLIKRFEKESLGEG